MDIKLQKLESLRKSPAYLCDESYKNVVDYTIDSYKTGASHIELTGLLYLRKNCATSRGTRAAATSCWNALMVKSEDTAA